MSTTLHTNRAAMSALHVIEAVSNRLEGVQNRIATGKRVNGAADNASYWSISNGLHSDSEATSVIKDALSLGKSRVDQGYVAVQQIRKELEAIQKDLMIPRGTTKEDQAKVRASVEAKLENVKMAIGNGYFNGENLLIQKYKPKPAKPTDPVPADVLEIASSFHREGDKISVDTIKIDRDKLHLVSKDAKGNLDYDKGALSSVLGGTQPLFREKWVDSTGKEVFKDKNGSYPSGATQVMLTNADLDEIASKVQKSLNDVAKVEAQYGAYQNQIDSQHSYIGKLVDNLDKSVGALVDADLNAESAKLSALQVQQQLSVQALSIANQSSQHFLTLFR